MKLNVKEREAKMLPSGLVSSRCKLKKAPKRERKEKISDAEKDEEEEEEEESPLKSRMGKAIG